VGIRAQALYRSPALRVLDVVCDSGPRDPSFEEQHGLRSISFVWSGTFQYRVGKVPLTLVPGALLLGNRGATFTCSHEHSTGDRCLSFHFSDEAFEDIQREVGVEQTDFPCGSLPPAPEVAARVLPMLAGESAAETAYRLAAVTLALQRPIAPSPITPVERRRAVEVARLIAERAAEPLPLETLAECAGTSAFHFLRSFKRALGVTPHQYVVQARLRRAAEALLDGDEPVTELAFAAGFTDLANFNRSFRRSFGCSPREYRRKFRKVVRDLAP
jgi:AraC family transcriptional regulator